MGSPRIKDFRQKFIEKGVMPLEEILNDKHKVDCIDKDGYRYKLSYHGNVGDKRSKSFKRFGKNNPYKAYNMRLYASRVQKDCVILSSDEELHNCENLRIRFKCPRCGKEFTKKWCHWLAMPLNCHVCPSCNDRNVSSGKSQYSLLTIEWFDSKGIKYLQEYTFPDCRNKNCLRFDFGIEWNGNIILVEVDGMQHFYTSGWTDEEKLKYNQKCDAIKNKYCEEKGYTLVRIPYWLFRTDSYKKILNKTFFG